MNEWHVSDVKCQVSSVRYSELGVRLISITTTTGKRHLQPRDLGEWVSCVRCLVAGVRCQVSSVKCQVSGIVCRVSDVTS